MAVRSVPDGYHTVTPCLVVQGAAELIGFMKQAFQATESERITRPDGTIMHAEVRIGDSLVMLDEAMDEHPPRPGTIYLYVDNADATYQCALQAGATSTEELTDQFWGDRMGGVEDPMGNQWWIAAHQEDISPEEMTKRVEAFMKQHAEH
jgi:PhnB protein